MTHAAPPHVHLRAYRGGTWQRSRDAAVLADGSEISLAPEIVVAAEAARLRRQTPPPQDLATILPDAAARFARDTLGRRDAPEETFASFAARLKVLQGIPPSVSAAWAAELEDLARGLAVQAKSDARCGTALVSLPSNTFLCLESVFALLADGHRVVLRPSQREPYSAARLVDALLASGLDTHRLALMPMSRQTLRQTLPLFSRAILYGGEEVERNCAALKARGTEVTIKGAGHGAAFVAAGWGDDAVRATGMLVARSAGRLCTNVRGVFVAERARAFAQALSEFLGRACADADDPRFAAPYASEAAVRQRDAVLSLAGDGIVYREGSEIEGRLGPVIVGIPPCTDHPLFGLEPLFPFAAVSAGAWPRDASQVERSLFLYVVAADGGVVPLRSAP